MSNSILRCVISEELTESDFPGAFGEIRDRGEEIFPGAKVVLDFGARSLSESVVTSLLSDFVWPSGISVAAWITYDAASQDILKRAGLPTSEPASSVPDRGSVSNSLVLHRSLRSGQRVEHRGDVIIAGHVNDAAEVLAAGSVTVLGRLSGVVHAGYEGDESTVVVARSMEALQVRIGGKIGSLDREAQWWGHPVIVGVREEKVLIEYWPVIKSENREDVL
jgi:septum site-determining protein MinC